MATASQANASTAAASRSRIRILILTDTAILGLGGGEGFLRRLVSLLPADRFSIDVLQLAAEPSTNRMMAQLPATSVNLSYLPVRAVYGRDGVAAWRHVRRLVTHGDYDVVQSQHEKSDLISALLPNPSGRLKRISNRRDMGFHKSRKLRWLMRRLNHRFDRVVAPSSTILDNLIREDGVAAARCTCIPNGVDTERFVPVEATVREQLREQLGFAHDQLLIGCAARFWRVKRHDDLIRAFALVLIRRPDARLVLIGDGPERPAIERLIAELGLGDAVRLLGARTDLENILPALDVFALTSSSEGLSNAIIEAQACGLPVVTTRVGGNPELVDDECGVLVPAHDHDAIANALLTVLADPALRSRMGATALARVRKQHSLTAMIDAYARLYAEVCDVG